MGQQVELIVRHVEPVRHYPEGTLGLLLTLQHPNSQELNLRVDDPQLATAILEEWVLACNGKRGELRYVFELAEALPGDS